MPALTIFNGKAVLKGALGRRLQGLWVGHIGSKYLLIVLEDVATIADSRQ
jgi:hypothetical protein